MTLMPKIFTQIDVRLPKIEQICIRSFRNYPTEYNTRKMDKKMPYPRPTKDIPGPKALPLIGNHFRFMPFIGEYYNVNVLTLMRMLRNKYGNIVKLDGLTQVQPQIFLFCPELYKDMYQCQGKMPMRIAMEPLHRYRINRENIYGKQYGLVTSQGELWQAFRSIVNKQMMQLQVIKSYVIPIQAIVSEFVETLRVLRDPKTLQLPNDFMNELHKWSLESMCSIALNSRLGCLKPNLVENSEPQIMINCVREMFDLIYRLENVPSLWKPTNTKNFEKLCETLDTINAISERYIEYAKTKFKTVENTNLKDCSVLKGLLCVNKQVAHVMALDIIMSTDTISNAAGALLYYIANNVEKQEKLREEVMSVLPNKTTPITYNTLQHVRYTKACIKESIRLFPIASGILRTMQRDVLIGGYIIPKGHP
ncbi:probable cytochrome P450 301a1, mitochondrial isoform X2 [Solenopsis invicta]|uniref:probable cytochrome P450 301a1, mitochondrial isoform X2 n=1 Tax=Solenopsis invicta TaxID=13686 RepID=UPI00193D4D0F|nr:probable cytochrome P450 301a1, mitochondrial isoform X2 [Solenopsis invicta]